MKNPLKDLMEKKNWTYTDLSIIADVSRGTIYKVREGDTKELNKNILNLVKEIGEDPEKFKKDYQKFRKEKKKAILRQ
jgi:transcriptional regulator with XRE-family HTH domain